MRSLIRSPFCAGNSLSWELCYVDVGILTQEVLIRNVLSSIQCETHCRRNAFFPPLSWPLWLFLKPFLPSDTDVSLPPWPCHIIPTQATSPKDKVGGEATSSCAAPRSRSRSGVIAAVTPQSLCVRPQAWPWTRPKSLSMICIATRRESGTLCWISGNGEEKKNCLNRRREQVWAVPTTRRLPELLVALLSLSPPSPVR